MKKGIPPIFYAFYEQEWYFSADFRGPVHMLTLYKDVFLVLPDNAVFGKVVGQRAVAGTRGALLGNIIQRCKVAAIGRTIIAKAEHMDACAVVTARKLRDQRLILRGTQQRIMVFDRHHNIRQTRRHNFRFHAVGLIRNLQSVSTVKLIHLTAIQRTQNLRRRHFHPNSIAGYLD